MIACCSTTRQTARPRDASRLAPRRHAGAGIGSGDGCHTAHRPRREPDAPQPPSCSHLYSFSLRPLSPRLGLARDRPAVPRRERALARRPVRTRLDRLRRRLRVQSAPGNRPAPRERRRPPRLASLRCLGPPPPHGRGGCEPGAHRLRRPGRRSGDGHRRCARLLKLRELRRGLSRPSRLVGRLAGRPDAGWDDGRRVSCTVGAGHSPTSRPTTSTATAVSKPSPAATPTPGPEPRQASSGSTPRRAIPAISRAQSAT